MSKLTLHVQSLAGYVAEFVTTSSVAWIKVVDPPVADPYPGVKTIGRMYMPDQESNALVWQGAAGADAWAGRWLPEFLARGYVHAWEGPNEPQPMADGNFRAALDAFTVRLVARMEAASLRLVGMCWGVGWPDVGHAAGFGASLTALAAGEHYLGLHQYSAPGMMDNAEWLSLRHRRTVAELEAAGIPVPQILITECGIDGGVIGPAYAGLGWRHFCDDDEDAYLAQLAQWDGEIKRDGEVEAAVIFTVCDWDWSSFHVTESLAGKLASYVAGDEEEPMPDPYPLHDLREALAWHPTARWESRSLDAIAQAIVHHTATEVATGQTVRAHIEAINRGHIEVNDWPRIGYHYVIGKAGVIWHCNRLDRITYHAGDANSASVGIALIGDLTKRDPTEEQLGALRWLRRQLEVPAFGHNEVMPTACPGPWWEAWKAWVNDMPEEAPVRFVWYDGTEVDEETFRAEFGEFQILAGAGYRVVELRAITGPNTLRVRLLDETGAPVADEGVVFSWPDAPDLPGGGWDEKGVVVQTDADGWADFAMGGGAYYWPEEGEIGPHQAWVWWGDGDYVDGLGMLGGTNHNHFDVVMQAGGGEPEPPPPPDGEIEALINEARALLAEADAKLVQALGLLP